MNPQWPKKLAGKSSGWEVRDYGMTRLSQRDNQAGLDVWPIVEAEKIVLPILEPKPAERLQKIFDALEASRGTLSADKAVLAHIAQTSIVTALKAMREGRMAHAVDAAIGVGALWERLKTVVRWETEIQKRRNSRDATKQPRPPRNQALAWLLCNPKSGAMTASPAALWRRWKQGPGRADPGSQEAFLRALRAHRRKPKIPDAKA